MMKIEFESDLVYQNQAISCNYVNMLQYVTERLKG